MPFGEGYQNKKQYKKKARKTYKSLGDISRKRGKAVTAVGRGGTVAVVKHKNRRFRSDLLDIEHKQAGKYRKSIMKGGKPTGKYGPWKSYLLPIKKTKRVARTGRKALYNDIAEGLYLYHEKKNKLGMPVEHNHKKRNIVLGALGALGAASTVAEVVARKRLGPFKRKPFVGKLGQRGAKPKNMYPERKKPNRPGYTSSGYNEYVSAEAVDTGVQEQV